MAMSIPGSPAPEGSSIEGHLDYTKPPSPPQDPADSSKTLPPLDIRVTRSVTVKPMTMSLQSAESRSSRERQSLSTLSGWKKWPLFACSCAVQFLLQLDMAAVAVTLQKIAKGLKAPQVTVFAVATAYFLALTVFQLVFSHMSHAVGRKWMYLFGVSLFLAGAGLAAMSQRMDVLVGARVMQGVGAAGMYTMSAILVVDIMQLRERAAWTSVSQAFAALGNICGPLSAGLLFSHFNFSWKSIFVTEAAFAGLLWAALAYLIPNQPLDIRHTLRELRRCDWVGVLAFFVCSVGILVPVNIGGATAKLEWNSAPIISSFVVGTASLAFLIYHQRCLAERPAFPRQIFRRPVTNIAFLGNAVCGMLLSMVFYNLVFFWEGVRQKTTLQTGKMLLSVTLTYPISSTLTGLAINRWGRIRWATVTGVAMSTAGLGLMQLMDDRTPEAALVLVCICASAGCGIFAPAVINTVLASTAREWHPHAIATRTLLYTAGQCTGVSLGVAIFTNSFKAQFTHGGGAARDILTTPQDLMRNIRELRLLMDGDKLVGMVINALRWVWGLACVLALVVGILASVVRCPDLPEDGTTAEKVTPDEERQDRSSVHS